MSALYNKGPRKDAFLHDLDPGPVIWLRELANGYTIVIGRQGGKQAPTSLALSF